MSDEQYETHRQNLLRDVKSHLQGIDTQLEQIAGVSVNVKRTAFIFMLVLLLNVSIILSDAIYTIYWVVTAYIFLMTNPFIMLIPKERKHLTGDWNKAEKGFSEIFNQAKGQLGSIRDQKTTYGEMVWNLFFINCQPLAPGFFVLFSVAILFAITGWINGYLSYGSMLIIIVQSIAIIVFYAAIVLAKPYNSGAFTRLTGIRSHVRETYSHNGVKKALKVVLIFAVVAAAIGVIFVLVLLTPGFSLGVFVTSAKSVGFYETKVLPFIIIFVFQVILVRLIQGVYSQRLVTQFLGDQQETLEDGILCRANKLPITQDGLSEEEGKEAEKELKELHLAFQRIRLLKSDYHHLGGYFPVYMIVPDIACILGSSGESSQSNNREI